MLLSHLHEDHFDRVAERRLDRALPIISTEHAAGALEGKGFRAARGLGPWESVDISKGETLLRVTAMPGKHGPGHAIPIHYNDYTVFRSPLRDFQRAVAEAGLRERVTYLRHGETYAFEAAPQGVTRKHT